MVSSKVERQGHVRFLRHACLLRVSQGEWRGPPVPGEERPAGYCHWLFSRLAISIYGGLPWTDHALGACDKFFFAFEHVSPP